MEYKILTSAKNDGSMDREHINENLPGFLKKNDIHSPVAYCEQIHGSGIKLIKKSGHYEGCDGLVTGEEIALFVKSADCVPLLFFDEKRGMHGAIHVGWRSLQKGIISSSLKGILLETSLSPSDIKVYLGPHIRKSNYEVRQDMISLLNNRLKKFVSPSNSRFFFDLTGSVIFELESIGVKGENIVDSGIDTFTDSDLFSYRNADKGLFITIVEKING